MLFITGARPTATELVGVVLPELSTPLANGLIGHLNAALKQQFLDATVTETEAVIEPDGVADDLTRKA
jgi:hypothetical protein